ncbi:yjeF C-terminal region, hydroxyethylthiazole kinase-related/yjeF N-terminal region [Lutibacter oricola]|uniref:Bifunctional NAD(P)H-hydrate repair enzyme n=1 Tax=Lutibacter oricola TaxID=762486 RepID=A0A1H3AFE4_9FLAO|nr:NAD(P)H-hydrate dehydratase [Lutibacter oricola]SDX28171.1 yjeF C-terminal region, hydroxyethylthiazole kinase-related/yjeF N-terminal region [Lutibacter oricola]
MYILNSKQIAKADKATINTNGISSVDLMENAATLCFQWLHSRLQGQQIKIHVFCGIGNNGGDGLVMARHLHQHGYNVSCYVVNFSDKRTNEFLTNYNRLKEIGEWPEVISHENEFPEVKFEDIVIDAIFGNGLSRKPAGFSKKLIQYINSTKVFTLAIDIPSGMYSDKSNTDSSTILNAGHTLTFQCPKLAFFLPENKEAINTWEVIDIGLDQNFIETLKPASHFIGKNEIKPLYKPRDKWSHKGTFGHSLIIGGSFGKIGAVTLASKAALKIGSGLVTAYTPKCGYNILQIAIPEAMVEVDDDNALKYFNFKTKPTVIGIGPGMGTSEKTKLGFEKFISENKTPLVIDADAINLLALNPNLATHLPKNSILTPHPKELERLIGTWKNDTDKIKRAQKYSKENNVIIVIKDAHTIVVNGNELFVNSTGNQALATAGSGDVLTGIITGLIAQGYENLIAAIYGVYLHGKTADIASQEIGFEAFTASTILDYLPDAILDLFKQEQQQPQQTEEEPEN